MTPLHIVKIRAHDAFYLLLCYNCTKMT